MNEQNPEAVQREIALLEEQLAAKRAELGQDIGAPYERTEVHAAIGERMGQEGYAPAAPASGSTAPSEGTPSWQDPALASEIQVLVNTAFTKGVQAAVGDAVKTGNAALIDAFHDVLTDEMHRQLIERGQVRPAA